MTTIASYYATLPTVDQAARTVQELDDFDSLLRDVGELLRPYGDSLGMCLLHHHFKLEDNEIMVDGVNGVAQPREIGQLPKVFPKRFDRNGKAYEFAEGG